jgi:CHAD domain-containing protein
LEITQTKMKNKTARDATVLNTLESLQSPSFGKFAHTSIERQYRHIVSQEKKVLVNEAPEPLHQMRVGTRRLRAALQVFDSTVKIPKAGSKKRLASFSRVLGKLRDFDVQISALKVDYRPQLSTPEQELLDEAVKTLEKKRGKFLSKTKTALTSSAYKNIKTTYKRWLKNPEFKAQATLPLLSIAPISLSNLVTTLLKHPGWQLSVDSTSDANMEVIHDLRKISKHVRYQAELFKPFYNDSFHAWIEELKDIQDSLGKIQDSQVLVQIIERNFPKGIRLPELMEIINDERIKATSHWEIIRQKYLDEDFQRHLQQIGTQG